jgi:hypothetical protein
MRRLSDDCPDADTHTPTPPGYLDGFDWADRMLKTHDQTKCPTCGFWVIWKPKKARS